MKHLSDTETLQEKLISLLSHTRNFSPKQDSTKYLIKRRLTGKSWHFHCGLNRMLEIKEIKSPDYNLNIETVLNCRYYFCAKCGAVHYNDGTRT